MLFNNTNVSMKCVSFVPCLLLPVASAKHSSKLHLYSHSGLVSWWKQVDRSSLTTTASRTIWSVLPRLAVMWPTLKSRKTTARTRPDLCVPSLHPLKTASSLNFTVPRAMFMMLPTFVGRMKQGPPPCLRPISLRHLHPVRHLRRNFLPLLPCRLRSRYRPLLRRAFHRWCLLRVRL